MKKYGKFAALIVVVIGTLVWLATAGMKETQTYYKTISEVSQMGDKAYEPASASAGDVESGSITRVGNEVHFVIQQEKNRLKVAYTAPIRCPIPSRTAPRLSPTANSAATASSTPPRFRPSAPPNTKPSPGMPAGQAAPNINTGKGVS